jgi:hypothetical protein
MIIGSGVFVLAAAGIAVWMWRKDGSRNRYKQDDMGGYFGDDNSAHIVVGYGEQRNEVSGMLFGGNFKQNGQGVPLLGREDLNSLDALDGGPPVEYIPSALQRMGGSGSGGATNGSGAIGMQDAVRTEREASSDLMGMIDDGVDDDALMEAEDRATINMRHNQQANQIMLALSMGGAYGSGNEIGGFGSGDRSGDTGTNSRRGRLTWDLPEGEANIDDMGPRDGMDTGIF